MKRPARQDTQIVLALTYDEADTIFGVFRDLEKVPGGICEGIMLKLAEAMAESLRKAKS